MGLTAYGKNNALAGAAAKMGFVGLFGFLTSGGEPKFALTANTVVGSSVLNLTGAKAKGFTNGAVVILRKLTGGVTGGLVEGRTLYVVGEGTNSFELAMEVGGVGIKVTGAELVAASTEVFLATELTGGSYTRVAATWGTASLGEILDTAAEVIKVPAGFTITDAGWFEKVTGGSGATGLQGTAKLVTAEPYVGEGEYKVTSDKLEANPVA